jgi:hypothetical protein
VDQVDFADSFWQDPSAWTAENISIQMGPLTELGFPVDIINQISAGMVQLESTGLLGWYENMHFSFGSNNNLICRQTC